MELADHETPSVNVGKRLRELREERGMSMRELARASGISANALSMIERSLTSPSVSTLYKLVDALNVPIKSLFGDESPREQIVFRRSSQRSRVNFPLGIWEGLGGEAFVGQVEPFMLTLESGANSGSHNMVHTGHEFVLCLQGELEYQVEGKKYLLRTGDSLLFAARLQHQWRNPGTEITNAMFVLSGFGEYESPGEYHYQG